MIALMTNKERLAILAIFVSVLGFAFVSALKPVMISYVVKETGIHLSEDILDQKLRLKSLHFKSNSESSKIVSMLSEVLGISTQEIALSLDGGSRPSELLASSGILLSDLAEEYSFDIVGDGLVRFRA